MILNNLKQGNALAPHRYLRHKDYFDNGLIDALDYQFNKVKKLETDIIKLREENLNKDAFIKTLNFKLKQFRVDNHNLKQALKSNDEEAIRIINEINRKYDDIEKAIDDELQRSYRDNVKINEELEKLKRQNEKLKRENDRLTRITSKDSTNSSLSPSSDIKTRKTKSTRIKSDLKLGGQVNHELHKSNLSKKVDRVIERTVQKAPTGSIPMLGDTGNILYYVTQEIDLTIESYVIETRYFIDSKSETCPDTILSAYKINPVNYSKSLVSIALYLNCKGTIPLDRLCLILKELSHNQVILHPGTIVKWNDLFTRKSKQTIDGLTNELLNSNLLHVDESGWKIDGSRYWVHVLCNNNTALYYCTKQRTGYIGGPIDLLENYTGYLMHDHYKPYYTRLYDCTHVECNAHIIRYLIFSSEVEKNIGCARMRQLFNEMIREVESQREKNRNRISKIKITQFTKRYHEIIDETLEKYYKENPNMPNKYKPSYVNLLKRLKEFSTEHLMFINNFNIPFDNNIAERNIRSIKTKKKVSGQSKTIEGARNYVTLHSVVQTCNIRKMNTLKTIEAILNNEDPFNCFFTFNNLSVNSYTIIDV